MLGGNIDLQHAIMMMVILLISIDIHELAHAVVADRLGDPTPRRMGEMSLNPFVHMDQIGLVLLVITSLTGFGFTYGRTHVTPGNMKFGPQRGNAIVAIAGPLSNLALAALVAIALSAAIHGNLDINQNGIDFLSFAVQINVLLFLLNLLPIPPLDGFTVFAGFLTARQLYRLAPYQQWGPLVILLLFIFDPQLGIISGILRPAMGHVLDIICSGCYVS